MSAPVPAPAPAGPPPMVNMINDPPKIHAGLMMGYVRKAHLRLDKIIVSGIVSGFYVMIGAHGMISTLSGTEPITKPLTILSGLVFSVALIGIVMAGGELFTGNCLMVISVLSKRLHWWELVINLIVVFFANLSGSIIFSAILMGTGFYADTSLPHAKTLCTFVHAKATLPIHYIFFRGIFANFCVCLAVILAMSSTSGSGRIIGMVWPIVVFLLSSFEHSVANQGLFALATMTNCDTPHGRYWVNLVFSTLGNIVGSFFISVAYYYVSICGTDLSLGEVPTYEADGVTIRPKPVEKDAFEEDDGCPLTEVRKPTSVCNSGRITAAAAPFGCGCPGTCTCEQCSIPNTPNRTRYPGYPNQRSASRASHHYPASSRCSAACQEDMADLTHIGMSSTDERPDAHNRNEGAATVRHRSSPHVVINPTPRSKPVTWAGVEANALETHE